MLPVPMSNETLRLARLRRPFVLAALLGLAACQDPEQAREDAKAVAKEAKAVAKEAGQEVVEASKDVAQATKEVAQATKELTQEQLEKVDGEKIEKAVDGVADALGTPVQETEPGVDPLAGAAEAIKCDEARTRCTMTTDFADRARRNGRKLAEQLGASQATGPVKGIQIDTIDPGSVAELVGLKVGDVITHVNEKEVGSPEDVVGLYLEVRGSDSFVIDYRRGTEARTLTIDVV